MATYTAYPPPQVLPSGADIDPDDEKIWGNAGVVKQYLKQRTPKAPQRLKIFDVVCIISNRMIGSGIFLTPTTLVRYTQSLGITLLFWFAGAVSTMCGILMFMEYGLTSPRYRLGQDRRKTPVPRSGGELHYLKEIISRPPFLAVSLYGIAFVLFGNVATNSMAFGVRVLQAAGHTDPVSQWSVVDNWIARGIALVVVTGTCAIHAFWRLGGIYLNNCFAVVKLSMLLFIFITGCLTWGGVFHRDAEATSNLNASVAFENPSTDAYAFAEAYLAVVFAFGGFNQANYVMGEIDAPQRNYKWPAFFTVGGVSVLYLLVNVAYMLVVPAADQKAGKDIAVEFFKLTYGSLGTSGADAAPRLLYAFMAISSLGNIIVMTYTAARVKQEIAKEGILPFRRFFARSWRMPGIPLARLLCRRYRQFREDVPLGALLLHWIVSVALVIFTCPLDPLNAYRILVSLYSYTIDAFFGVVLGAGIFYLRARRELRWAEDSFLVGGVSLTVALVYGLSMLFPIITSWVPPSVNLAKSLTYPWFTTPTVSWIVVALGLVYWAGFYGLYPLLHRHQYLLVRRFIYLNEYNVMHHEKFNFVWVDKESGDANVREDVTTERRPEEDDPDY